MFLVEQQVPASASGLMTCPRGTECSGDEPHAKRSAVPTSGRRSRPNIFQCKLLQGPRPRRYMEFAESPARARRPT